MIKEKDGIHIDLGKKVVADSRKAAGDVIFVSHAHMDHLHTGNSGILCSEKTARIGSQRSGKDIDFTDNHGSVELLPSGHIIGSRAALIEDEKRVLYTGDVSTRDRLYLDGFEPVDADILVLETTYGVPAYDFPSQEKIEKEIKSWIQGNDSPLMLFGYSLGKAQKIQYLVQEITDRPMVAHGSVEKVNQVVEKTTDLEFTSVPYQENRELLKENGILVAPSGSARSDWVKKLKKEIGALKAGFSGWAVNDSFKYRGEYDRTFPLSDHCDFTELVEIVEKVDPEKVYTHHGFDEAFASYVRKELGYNAQPLKRNQSTLKDF